MIGRILALTAVIVPFWLVRTMVSWRETIEVLPAILVVGLSFAGMQWFWANHMDSNLVDIAAAVTAMVAALLFLRVWHPKRIWRFEEERAEDAAKLARNEAALHHTGAQVAKAWMPFAILSLFVLLWGLPSIKTAMGRATTPAFASGGWDVPYLHKTVSRAQPVVAKTTPESAKFDFNWRAGVGTGCFLPSRLSGLLLGLKTGRILCIFWLTLIRLPFPVVAMT